MPTFQEFMRALREQALLSQRAPVVQPKRGTPGRPLTPNRDFRFEEMRRAAVNDAGFEGNPAMQDVPDELEKELIEEYAQTRNRLDERDKLEAQVRAQGGDFIVMPNPAVVAAGQYTRPEDDPFAREGDRIQSMHFSHPEERLVPALGSYFDNEVARRGWRPEDFEEMTPYDAAAVIASQLKARRIRTMGQFSPDYIDTLPVY